LARAAKVEKERWKLEFAKAGGFAPIVCENELGAGGGMATGDMPLNCTMLSASNVLGGRTPMVKARAGSEKGRQEKTSAMIAVMARPRRFTIMTILLFTRSGTMTLDDSRIAAPV